MTRATIEVEGVVVGTCSIGAVDAAKPATTIDLTTPELPERFIAEAQRRMSRMFSRTKAHVSGRQGHTRKARRAARRFFRWVWLSVLEPYRSRVRRYPCTPRGADRMLSWLDANKRDALAPWVTAKELPPPLALVANVREPGTKHFAAGAKVTVLPIVWGDGVERVRVVASHRGKGRRLITMVMPSKTLESWRVKELHDPRLVGYLRERGHVGSDNVLWSREVAERVAAGLSQRPPLGGGAR